MVLKKKTAEACIFHTINQFWVKILSKLSAIYGRYSSTQEQKSMKKIFLKGDERKRLIIFPVWLRLFSRFFLTLAFRLMNFNGNHLTRIFSTYVKLLAENNSILNASSDFTKYETAKDERKFPRASDHTLLPRF